MSNDRPSSPPLLRLIMCLSFVLMFSPLITVFIFSFLDPVHDGGSGFRWTLKWYLDLMGNKVVADALARSLVVAASVAVLSGLIGALGALALDRGTFPGLKLLKTISALPLVMPELVLGLSSLIWFVMLRMTFGLHSIVFAHVTFTVSYVVVIVSARLQEFDRSIEEAAADLGAEWWRVILFVVFPNVWSAIAAGMMMAFVLSFDDFLISFFTSGVGSDTLPLKLYSMIRFGMNRQMYALSSLLVVASILLAVFFRKLIYRPTGRSTATV